MVLVRPSIKNKFIKQLYKEPLGNTDRKFSVIVECHHYYHHDYYIIIAISISLYRSQGLALLSVTSRCGAASAPWVAQYLGYYSSYLPFLLMGSLTLVSGGLCIKLKETTGLAMAETLDDTNRDDGMI